MNPVGFMELTLAHMAPGIVFKSMRHGLNRAFWSMHGVYRIHNYIKALSLDAYALKRDARNAYA